MRSGADLTLVFALVFCLHGIDAEAPLVRAGVVIHFNAGALSVQPTVHRQKVGVAVTNPGDLRGRHRLKVNHVLLVGGNCTSRSLTNRTPQEAHDFG